MLMVKPARALPRRDRAPARQHARADRGLPGVAASTRCSRRPRPTGSTDARGAVLESPDRDPPRGRRRRDQLLRRRGRRLAAMNVARPGEARAEARSRALYAEALPAHPGRRQLARCAPCAPSGARTRCSSRAPRAPSVEDADGNRYVDLVGSWGPMILGHAHPGVLTSDARDGRRAAPASARRPSSRSSSPTAVKDAMPVDRAGALRQLGHRGDHVGRPAGARGFTGRDKILKFAGCYHGHADALLVEAGSGLATLGIPASPGRAAARRPRHAGGAVQRPRRACASVIERHGDELAA